MDLSRIRIEARVRSQWQAVDLGFVLARQWWKPLFLSWFIPSFALYAALSLVYDQRPWLAPLAIWWLKPFWDRGPLYVASRALFDERLSISQVLAALPGLYRRDFFAWITLRRLSLNRSFEMPVTILELLNGRACQSRLQALRLRQAHAASWLSLICLALEALLVCSVYALATWMMPEHIDIAPTSPLDRSQALIGALICYGAMALLAPFYTMAGFALYISRRIDLEAWDIEIRFRHLAAEQARRRPPALLCAALVLAASLLCLQPSRLDAAAFDAADSHLQKHSQQLIQDVLAGDDFHRQGRVSRWRFKHRKADSQPSTRDNSADQAAESRRDDPKPPASDSGSSDDSAFSPSEAASGFLMGARVIEIFLWALAALLLVYLGFHCWKVLKQPRKPQPSSSEQPREPGVLFGLDVSQASLPTDVPSQVQALWQAEQYRDALGLLYRAMLSNLIHQHQFVFSDGHTEGECVAIVRQRGNRQLSAYTEQLTSCWQQLAYGHRIPTSEQVTTMCQQWRDMFSYES